MKHIALNDTLASRFDFRVNLGREVRFTGSVQKVRILSGGASLKDKTLNPSGIELEATAIEMVSNPGASPLPRNVGRLAP